MTVDLDEYFIDEEGVAEALVFALQSFRIQRTEFVAPKSNRLVTHIDAAFSKQIFDVPVAEIEPMIEPDGILDDGWRKPVTLVDVG